MNEDQGGLQGGGPIPSQQPNIAARQYHYLRYPNEYIMDQGFKVTKFERNYQNTLTYNFVRAFPVSISSMPLTYDASALLKITVSMSYIRYYVDRAINPTRPSQPPLPTIPEQVDQNNTSSPLILTLILIMIHQDYYHLTLSISQKLGQVIPAFGSGSLDLF